MERRKNFFLDRERKNKLHTLKILKTFIYLLTRPENELINAFFLDNKLNYFLFFFCSNKINTGNVFMRLVLFMPHIEANVRVKYDSKIGAFSDVGKQVKKKIFIE